MTTSEDSTAGTIVATATDYRRALLAIRDLRDITPATWELWCSLLRTHYRMPGHAATAAQLATANRVKTPGAVNLSYGKLAHAVADQLGYCPPERQHGKHEPMWWMALSSGSQGDEREEQFQFTMHSELAAALELMRWVKPQACQT
jgi:predicted HNH restriction endonuclease